MYGTHSTYPVKKKKMQIANGETNLHVPENLDLGPFKFAVVAVLYRGEKHTFPTAQSTSSGLPVTLFWFSSYSSLLLIILIVTSFF